MVHGVISGTKRKKREYGYSVILDNHERNRVIEGMITVSYRPNVAMEHDILVGVLLVMYMGNGIP